MISLILVFILCFGLSAFFSVTEMAFVTANRFKIRQLADSGDPAAKTLLYLVEHSQQFLTALLIANNIVNISAVAIFTYMLKLVFNIESELVVTAIMAPLLLIFGETVPKDYGRLASENFLLNYAGIFRHLARFFSYPVGILMKLISVFLSPFGSSTPKSIFVNEKEFRSLIEESTRSGVVSGHEKQLIDTILDFERMQIESVMLPVAKVSKVNITDTIKVVKEIGKKTRAKMVLVYEEIPSIIVGMIYVFDLLFEMNEEATLKNYLRSPIFLSRNISLEKAFLTLQEKRQSFALVTDEEGEVIGAVPIERLLAI